MMPPCYSDHRCARTSCEPCSWRYSLHVSRRILVTHPRQLYAVTIDATLQGPADFSSWRIQVRNLLDYRRRACRWWREVGLWLWLSADGCVRGIVSLGAVTEGEFIGALGRRWPTRVTGIAGEDLRSEAYLHALRPGVILDTGPRGGRYQGIRVAVKPHGMRSQAITARGLRAVRLDDAVEAMPTIL